MTVALGRKSTSEAVAIAQLQGTLLNPAAVTKL